MNHASKAAEYIADLERSQWHDKALWWVRQKRDNAKSSIPEWEILRTWADQIKGHTLSKLDEYLIEFESNAIANGVHVHWASTPQEHNEIVLKLLNSHGAKRLVKSKSMLTEECELNPYLEAHGIEVTDTDLGERIIQMREEPPSHIVMPAIHIKKEEVSQLFHDLLQTEPNNNDPTYLTNAARTHLREKFLEADASLTGVNFAIAETGEVVVCTNEGNANMGINITPLQIHCMGIEKLIPKREHLGVFTRILARSATGQAITTYTTHHRSARPGTQKHIVIVDNHRSRRLGEKDFYNSLKCIRCGACMNTCPVYRRGGGHAYNTTIPGPIGAILNPAMDVDKHKDLPFASTLCGSCDYVCPVKIDISSQLYKWRQVIGKKSNATDSKSISMGLTSSFLGSKRFNTGMKILRKVLPIIPRPFLYNRWNTWGKNREIPKPPKESFVEWYEKRHKK